MLVVQMMYRDDLENIILARWLLRRDVCLGNWYRLKSLHLYLKPEKENHTLNLAVGEDI